MRPQDKPLLSRTESTFLQSSIARWLLERGRASEPEWVGLEDIELLSLFFFLVLIDLQVAIELQDLFTISHVS